MRGVALGRKNWIHVGSEKAGPKVAAILSVTESCRRLGLNAREYLASILPGMANRPVPHTSSLREWMKNKLSMFRRLYQAR